MLRNRALDVSGDVWVTGKITTSNLQVLGTHTVVNGLETVTSNVTISNTAGFGPALRVSQTGTGANYPIADFYNVDVSTTVPALRIADGGNVGLGVLAPTHKLDVSGSAYVSGALDVSGSLRVLGTVTAGAFAGNGSALTNLPGATFSGGRITGSVGIGTDASSGFALDVSGIVNVGNLVTAKYFRQTSPVWFQIFGATSGNFGSGPVTFTGNALGTAILTYNTTAGVWQPTVAGLYMVTLNVLITATISGTVAIRKNSSNALCSTTTGGRYYVLVSGCIFMNGASDFCDVVTPGGEWNNNVYLQTVLLV